MCGEAYWKTSIFAKMTAVGFEPTPLRTGAWSQRLRPLGQTVLPSCSGGALRRYHCTSLFFMRSVEPALVQRFAATWQSQDICLDLVTPTAPAVTLTASERLPQRRPPLTHLRPPLPLRRPLPVQWPPLAPRPLPSRHPPLALRLKCMMAPLCHTCQQNGFCGSWLQAGLE